MPRKRKCEDVQKYEENNKRSHYIKDHLVKNEFSPRQCVRWFRDYSDDSNIIGPEGIEKFCHDVGLEPENIIFLVIAWKMNAKKMGYFTLQEWLTGFTDLQCDSLGKLRSKLVEISSIINDSASFRSIFRYAYDFAKETDQRSMDVETASKLLQLLLSKRWVYFQEFVTFLNQSRYKVISKDQWYNVLEFSRAIYEDFSNYDVDGAWPVMLDEFVEWLKNLYE